MRTKHINLEILRIFACFLVIVNHTNSRIFLSSQAGSLTWTASILYFFVCKIAVPVFIMISGATLLGKTERYRDVFFKRVLKFTLVLVVFSLPYYINDIMVSGAPFDVFDFFHAIYPYNITNAFWYLYLYLGLMISLPILRRMAHAFSDADYVYSTVVFLVYFGTIPVICHFMGWHTPSIALPTFSYYIIYFLLGYFIQNRMNEKYFSVKYTLFAIISFIACMYVSVAVSFNLAGTDAHLLMDNTSFFNIAIPSISAFYLSICFTRRVEISSRVRSVLLFLGGCTFGIYLLSDLLIEKFEFIYLACLDLGIHRLPAIVVLQLCVFVAGLLITVILKHIPLIKKLV